MGSNSTGRIADLVAELPELYQPIFGHPEYKHGAARASEDRLATVASIQDALRDLLGRPLRILDLGCAQGFFSLSLASLGNVVHGIDFLDKNIAVCQALADCNPHLRVSFKHGRIEEVLSEVKVGEYDLVLGLSVLHHIVHEQGARQVSDMLAVLAEKVPAAIFELALASEPLYWASAQPDNPVRLLDGFAFTHELGRHSTHLSDIARPLYFASNTYWYLDGVYGRFREYKNRSHKFAADVHLGSRRYFLGDSEVVKVFRLDEGIGPQNVEDLARESAFLSNPPPGFNAPEIKLAGRSKYEAWLVREKLNGETLLEIIQSDRDFDARQVLREILRQCVVLEKNGLYHSDIRTWNVLVGSDQSVHLIDYGSIGSNQRDCVWPTNLYLAFLTFVHEVVGAYTSNPLPVRDVVISPNRFPGPFRYWVSALWARPVAEWSFELMLSLFEEVVINGGLATSGASGDVWQSALEEGMQEHARQANQLHLSQFHARETEKYAKQAEAKLALIYASASWRITTPLRVLHRLLRGEWRAVAEQIRQRLRVLPK